MIGSFLSAIALLFSINSIAGYTDYQWGDIARPHSDELGVGLSFHRDLLYSRDDQSARDLAWNFSEGRFFGSEMGRGLAERLKRAVERLNLERIVIGQGNFYSQSGHLTIPHDWVLSAVVVHLESLPPYRVSSRDLSVHGVGVKWGTQNLEDVVVVVMCDEALSYLECSEAKSAIAQHADGLHLELPETPFVEAPELIRVRVHGGESTFAISPDRFAIALEDIRSLHDVVDHPVTIRAPDNRCDVVMGGE